MDEEQPTAVESTEDTADMARVPAATADMVTTTDIQLLNACIHPLSAVRDLGVTIDCRLTMADQVTAVYRTGYFWLRQLRSK